ncbi:hypothetical protein FIBSPDRAFT_523834 [Athelia psychrophila]|uniref:Tetratricopeptide SHNi-TPR domain-containing protein n=1 Tax=Athelia psychrophila TaxID=1759441 RepID=A0A166JP58_9AGAM|nr:hypothetical protein FIBSPDRAFT_523834 [Fibularhizoctonia sp. CBS 109695]
MSLEHNTSNTPIDTAVTKIQEAVDQAKRAFALKKYEQSVDHYATALELATEKYGEDALESADLYFAYGKALLENAISQSNVLGKEQPEDGTPEPDTKASGSGSGGPILSFSGDAEDLEDDDEEEEPTVDLFAEALKLKAEADHDEEDEEEEGAEPEDDFNAAWEVLDLARAIYDKGKDDSDEVKLKLADTYITLGDISLETEKFDQAILDYEVGLKLKHELLPTSSRQIAEAHYKLSMVLDLTSGRLSDAILHAEKALESVEARSVELRDGLAGQLKPESRGQAPAASPSGKGKGKSTGGKLVRDDLVQNMTKPQIEGELKELQELKEDLALKVEELKTSPEELGISAPTLAEKVLDQELNGGITSTAAAALPVNDLTSMVVKRKKKAPETTETTASGKRKADDGGAGSPSEKKAKLDDDA